MNITETFYPKGRKQWRQWLEANHKTASEIWLIYFKKHTRKPTVRYNEAVEEALCFGWINDAKKEETRQQRIAKMINMMIK